MPATIDTAVSETVGAAAQIVARPVAALDASGEASLTTLQQVSVSVAYDDMYDISLNPAHSTALANAFKITGAGSSFTVTLEDADGEFQGVLATAMEAAICTEYKSTASDDPVGSDAPTGQGLKLKDTILNGMINTFKTIFSNALPNVLESDLSISNTVYYAEGAANMAGLLTDQECEILAQQLPEANYELYAHMDASENAVTDALPLKGNDSIVFVFNVSVNSFARVDKKTAGTAADNLSGVSPGDVPAGSGAVGSGPYGVAQQSSSVTYASSSRTVAFRLTVHNAAGNADKLDNLRAIAA